MIITLINTMYKDNFINRNYSDLAPFVLLIIHVVNRFCIIDYTCSEHVQGTEIKVIHAEIYASYICGCNLEHYEKDWRH